MKLLFKVFALELSKMKIFLFSIVLAYEVSFSATTYPIELV